MTHSVISPKRWQHATTIREPLLDARELSSYLQCSKAHIGHLVADGLPFVDISRTGNGRVRRYKVSAVVAWLDKAKEVL
jgi:predicted DNA-binding transcriptional regulator AlpA